MSSSSNSKSSTKKTESNIDSRQFNLQEIDGPAVVGGKGDMDVRFSDQGAIEAGRDTAMEALDLGGQVTRDALDFGYSVQREATESQREALQSVEGSNQRILEAQGQALEFADEATRSEDARNLDQIVKYGALALAATVAIPAVTRAMRG